MEIKDNTNKRKIKTIITLAVAGCLIFFVAIWAIGAVLTPTKKISPRKDDVVVKTQSQTETNKSKISSNVEAKSPANNYTPRQESNKPDKTTQSTKPANNPSNTEKIPSTGPVDHLIAILALGLATYLIGLNFQLKKAFRQNVNLS